MVSDSVASLVEEHQAHFGTDADFLQSVGLDAGEIVETVDEKVSLRLHCLDWWKIVGNSKDLKTVKMMKEMSKTDCTKMMSHRCCECCQ